MGLEKLFNYISSHINKYSSNAAYGWSVFITTASQLSLQEWAFVTGIFVALVTCFVNWYYRRKAVMYLKSLSVSKKVYEEINR